MLGLKALLNNHTWNSEFDANTKKPVHHNDHNGSVSMQIGWKVLYIMYAMGHIIRKQKPFYCILHYKYLSKVALNVPKFS